MDYTRRELGRLMLTSVPLATLFPRIGSAMAKPNSTFAGVTVGMNVPYNFDPQMRAMPVDEVIAKTTQLNVSMVELRSQPIERLMGAPVSALQPARGAEKQSAEDLRAWRLKMNPADAAKARKQFDEAGIKIDIVKFDNIYNFTDPEMDYAFALAKAAGARGISCELEADGVKRVGQFADKHNMPVGYHGHTKTPESMFKEAFAAATHNWANLDIGHYIAGNLGDPVD
ncbi:MAG TPA: hypothetical protein VH138_15855, partial [Vicinamibacterales bacterium]|nr:hypothetical protein [Vicinamibacterales bacterium]